MKLIKIYIKEIFSDKRITNKSIYEFKETKEKNIFLLLDLI